MKVACIFEPDAGLGPDPLDTADPPDERSLGVFLDAARDDIILVWRTYGAQYEDGFRTQLVGAGIWENVSLDQLRAAVELLGDLPEEHPDGDH